MEKAIIKAIEGGWKQEGVDAHPASDGHVYTFGRRLDYSEALLDPLFWQALGKAMGWNSEIGDSRIGGSPSHEWKQQRNRFIDHLDKGGNVDEFFTQLI